MSSFLDKLNQSKKSREFPFLVLAFCILLTVAATYIFYLSSKGKDEIRFNNEVNRLQTAFENKLNLYVSLLKGGRGFVESSKNMTRREFADYVASLELEKNYAGVVGIGYSKRILPEEREALREKMAEEGFADFKIFPEKENDPFQTIIYLEPLNERSLKAIGFDMASEPIRRNALEQAAAAGQATTSAKVKLIQNDENDASAGFLIYLPIYDNGKIPATSEERRKNIKGYIYSPFRANDFLEEIQDGKAAAEIEIKIYDGEIKAENLLAQTASTNTANVAAPIEKKFTQQSELDIPGRKWFIEYNSLPPFAEQSSLGWTPLVFLIGIVFSLILFGLTYWESSARVKLENNAVELLKHEQQKQILLEQEQKARRSAEQANRTKDEFLAMVSHELRTPLNAIAGWTQILKTNDLAAKTKNLALEKIDKNLRSQTRLVEEILDYSQMLSGLVELGSETIDFSNLFEGIFREFETKAEEKNIEFYKDNQLNGQQVVGDGEKIKIVIANLLRNAIKFTPSGGKIETSLAENNGNIKLEIKDSGKGIDAAFLPHIFDRFYQDDNSTTRNYGGLGLGLTICKHIVQLHRGVIKADSAGQGKGSVFTVELPRVQKI